MRDNYFRYFVGFVISVGLIFLVIFLLVNGGKDTKSPASPVKPLYTYANTDAVVKMTIEGQVTAPQNRNTIVVTVGATEATFQQYVGYDGSIVATKSYENTRNSYETLLRSLAVAGFRSGNNDPALRNSDGYCPLGRTYRFQMIENDKDLQNYWITSCPTTHTFNGNATLVRTLFQNQIPDYNTLTSNVTL